MGKGKFIQEWSGQSHSHPVRLKRNRSKMASDKDKGHTLFSFWALWIFGDLSFNKGKHAWDFPSNLYKLARATQR